MADLPSTPLARSTLVTPIVAAIALLPISLLILFQPGGFRAAEAWQTVVIVALLALLHGAATLAVARPLPAFAVASAIMLGLALLPIGTTIAALLPSSAVYLFALSQAVAAADRRLRRGAPVVGVVGAAIMTIADSMRDPSVGAFLRVGEFVGLTASIAAATAVGMLLRAARERVEARAAERVRTAIADERARITRDLHDVVAHSLTVMIAQAEAAAVVVDEDPRAAASAMQRVAELGRTAMSGMRDVIGVDRGAGAPGLAPAAGAAELPELVAATATAGHRLDFRAEGAPVPLGPAAELALHRGVQEALTNVVRHVAPPATAVVSLRWQDDGVEASIADDGGSGAMPDAGGSGVGLIGMAERVRRAGGSVAIERGRGWTVRIRLPRQVDA